VQLDTISPNLGTGFLKNAALAGLGAIIGVIIVVSIRYRKPKYVWPMSLISISEVLMILGVAVLINWTIDLPAIAGIIASVGTGIDSQIIILDQTIRGERLDMSFKEKLKRAFFVVFGSAGTVIAAMLPLMTLGFGMLRGFAITTIIGVLIGVLIARPAYGVIVEKMHKI
jgi:preprotein translocase subunit SecD